MMPACRGFARAPSLHSAAMAPHRGRAVTGAVLVALAIVAVPAQLTATVRARPAFSLVLVRDVVLPGNPTRFDYQSVDAAKRRLYIAHLGDSALLVVDLKTLDTVASVPGIAEVHGV